MRDSGILEALHEPENAVIDFQALRHFRQNVPDPKTLPHPGPLPVAAPLAKGEGELFADGLKRRTTAAVQKFKYFGISGAKCCIRV